MRIREMQWKDYSLTNRRVKELREYCRDSDNMSMVTQAAACASPSLAGVIVKSLTTGIGYVEMSKKEYIPATGADFYAYQRRTIAFLDVLLRGRGLGLWVDMEAAGQIKRIIR